MLVQSMIGNTIVEVSNEDERDTFNFPQGTKTEQTSSNLNDTSQKHQQNTVIVDPQVNNSMREEIGKRMSNLFINSKHKEKK